MRAVLVMQLIRSELRFDHRVGETKASETSHCFSLFGTSDVSHA